MAPPSPPQLTTASIARISDPAAVALFKGDFVSEQSAQKWLAGVSRSLRGRPLTEQVLLAQLFFGWIGMSSPGVPAIDRPLPSDNRFLRLVEYGKQDVILALVDAFQQKLKKETDEGRDFTGESRLKYMETARSGLERRLGAQQRIHGEDADPLALKAFGARGKIWNEFQKFVREMPGMATRPFSAQVDKFIEMKVQKSLLASNVDSLTPAQQQEVENRILREALGMRQSLLRPTKMVVSGESRPGGEEDQPTLLESIGVEMADLSPKDRSILSFIQVVSAGNDTALAELPPYWAEYIRLRVRPKTTDAGTDKTRTHAEAQAAALKWFRASTRDAKALAPSRPAFATNTMRQLYGIFDINALWDFLATGSFSSSDSPRSNPMPRAQVLYPRYTRYGGVNSGNVPVHVPGVPFTQFPNLFLSNPGEEMRSTEARFAGKCKVSGEAYAAGTTIYKHPTLGWCTQAGLDMASSMSEDEIQAMMAAQQRNKHLTEAEQAAWESLGGSITSNGRPLMDRKFVSIKNAKEMIQASGGAMSNPRRNGRTSHRFGY